MEAFAFPGNIDLAGRRWPKYLFIVCETKFTHRWITNNFPCKWHTSATSGSKSSPRKVYVAWKRKMLNDVIDGHQASGADYGLLQAYIQRKIYLWSLEFRSWLRPRAVSRLRLRFPRDKIIKSLRSELFYFILFYQEWERSFILSWSRDRTWTLCRKDEV